MASFDGGFYQLTALVPILQDGEDPRQWSWHPRPRSAVHSLRELLDSLRTVDVPLSAAEREGGIAARAVPFSRNDRTHFASLLVVDDLAYNGRQKCDTLIGLLRDLISNLGWELWKIPNRDQVDHLPHPYLLVLLNFDAPDGCRSSVERYLHELWGTMEQEWTLILRHCRGFDQEPERRERSFVSLILEHEIESTMSFSTYNWAVAREAGTHAGGKPQLWGPLAVAAPLGLLALAGLAALWMVGHPVLALLGMVLLLLLLWQGLLRWASRPSPSQPGTDLRSLLKDLHLQSAFLEMAETWQNRSASGPHSLRDHFRDFLHAVQPGDVDGPSLSPGQIYSIHNSHQP